MSLTVYNLITQSTREVVVKPSLKWGKSLLGADVRFEDYSYAHASVYYVEEVKKDSPADKAKLIAETDYIVGSKQFEFHELDDIGNLIERSVMILFLINANTCL